jgi:chemotaxis protein MotB
MKIAMPVLLAAMVASGCVTKGKYDEAVAETQTTRAELRDTDSALKATRVEAQARAEEIAKLQALVDDLTKASKDEMSTSSARIAELRKMLAEAKSAREASESRAALFRSIALRLQKQVDAGDLTVTVRDGRMVLQLPNDVLFDTGKTELKPAGKAALTAIAGVLKTVNGRQFQVAGHTDDVPIHNDLFASNWELSSGRALRVAHFLMTQGVEPKALSAAGYADVDPVSANASPEGRKHNRRTEITLQPNVDDLVRVP